VPRVLITDKLATYGVAHRQLISSVEHRRSKYLNNRAEDSHQAARTRDEKFHLPWSRAAVSVGVQRHITPLPTSPPPTHRSPVPT
jgi:transposase-like protein